MYFEITFSQAPSSFNFLKTFFPTPPKKLIPIMERHMTGSDHFLCTAWYVLSTKHGEWDYELGPGKTNTRLKKGPSLTKSCPVRSW